MNLIYLDYNATTPMAKDVVAAMEPWLHTHFGNPSSSHIIGAEAALRLQEARREAAGFLNCSPVEITFTSGGTEANNLAIRGAAKAVMPRGGHVIASAVEHPAVIEVLEGMKEELDYTYTLIPVDRNCQIDPETLAAAITGNTVLVTLMQANNETGVIQPVEEVSRLTRKHGILLHTDAAQTAGKIPLDATVPGADLITLAGHKIYGPKGAGLLYARKGIPISPVLRGAGQEKGIRPGTESVMLAAGLGRACRLAGESMARDNGARLATLRDRLEQQLLDRIPGAHIHGQEVPRLPNTCSIYLPGVTGTELVAELGDRIAFSAGAACHGDTVELSPVLAAMGVSKTRGRGTIRLSVGKETTIEEIDQATAIITAWLEEKT